MRKVPKLRFKEFSDEWQEKKLGEITKITAGGTPSTTKIEYWNGNIKWMNSGELNLKYVYEVQGRITEEGLKNSSTKLIPKNCVLIGLAGQGKTRGTVAINFIELCTNQSIASILPNYQSFIPLFLYFNLDNRYEELRGLSTGGGGRGGLNLGILNSLTNNFPSLQEQEKIANFLSSIDKKISLIEEKLALFREYKKGVMQKIFSQELRFKDSDGNDYPEWEDKRLGEIGEIIGGGTPPSGVIEYWNGNIQWFTPSEIGKNKYVNKSLRTITEIGLKNSSAKLLPKGTILLSSRATIGEKSIALEKVTTNQGFQSIFVNEKNYNEFIYYLLDYIKPELIKKATGSTFLEIGAKSLKEISTKLPTLEEQQKIANFLSSIDSKIENIEKELERLKEFKKGLLQQMFV